MTTNQYKLTIINGDAHIIKCGRSVFIYFTNILKFYHRFPFYLRVTTFLTAFTISSAVKPYFAINSFGVPLSPNVS